MAAMLLVGVAGMVAVDATAIPPLMTRIATRRTSALAAEFSITRPDDAALGPADFRGSVVVLDFWATWCPPCRR